MSNLFEVLTEKFPFLTIVLYGNDKAESVGIIQNTDNTVTSFYDYALLKTDTEKKDFLRLGDTWWWESNRQVPINIYLKSEWKPFQYVLKTFITKEIEIVHGPMTSLANLSQKRSKRRSIILVRRLS